MKKSDVTMLDVGADSAGITAVETGAADLTVTTEPFYSMQVHQGGKYKIVFYGKDVLPPMTQTVGITTGAFAKSRGKELRAIVEARRKGVEFIYAHPDEAAAILVERLSFAARGRERRAADQFAKIRQMVERGQFRHVRHE